MMGETSCSNELEMLVMILFTAVMMCASMAATETLTLVEAFAIPAAARCFSMATSTVFSNV